MPYSSPANSKLTSWIIWSAARLSSPFTTGKLLMMAPLSRQPEAGHQRLQLLGLPR
jgi:hypothetical protein